MRMVSRFRCPVAIIGMTTSEKAWRKLNLSWGVKPVLCEEYNSMEVMFYNAMNEAKSVMKLKKGDHIVLTGGLINGKTCLLYTSIGYLIMSRIHIFIG